MPARHVPLRTCVICGSRSPKGQLLRIVAGPGEGVAVDTTGKSSGRGTYVCKDGNCAQNGLKRGRIEHVLRAKLKDEEWAELILAVEALGNKALDARTI